MLSRACESESAPAHRGRVVCIRGRARMLHQTLLFTPHWPDLGSAAGVRTFRLIKALSVWGCRVSVASAARNPCNTVERLAARDHQATFLRLSLNSMRSTRKILEQVAPDVVVFDRFYMEEAFGAHVQDLKPGVLRALDMQDCHALRLARQRVVEGGGSIIDAHNTWPQADDPTLVRELSAIHRSDLCLVCSPVEKHWLHKVCGVPAHKLVVAPLLGGSRSQAPPDSDVDNMSATHRSGFVSLGTFRHPPNRDGVQFLLKQIWPRVRTELPDAVLHIVGSYPRPADVAQHLPGDGVQFHGHLTDAALAKLLLRSRVLLAPVRFGAGLKGKVRLSPCFAAAMTTPRRKKVWRCLHAGVLSMGAWRACRHHPHRR